jgi:hypothetical protein
VVPNEISLLRSRFRFFCFLSDKDLTPTELIFNHLLF